MSIPRRRRRDREPLNQRAGTPATMPTTTGEITNSIESLANEPTHDDIARRAYQLYENRGGEHGCDLEDWFQAERELQPIALRVVERSVTTEGPYAAT